ncbi:MAG: lamin tail domain-containing protein [Chloroflexota bacterium]
MKRSALLGFVALNIVVTFATVIAIISIWNRVAPQPTQRPLSPPLIVVVTATLDPRGTEVTYKIITATLQAGAVPSGASPDSTTDAGTVEATNDSTALGDIPTLDPQLLPSGLGTADASGNSTVPGVATNANGCQTYALKKGDTVGSIATVFGVPVPDIMRANKLKDSDLTRLQIGQVLTIPLNGCGLATEEPTPTITPTKLILPTLPPTSTIAPTAAATQIEIAKVISAGDITSEGVEIHNTSGALIQMKDWTLTDANGLKFTFPDYRMFPGGQVTIYTKSGTNTPVVLYWGQSQALWTAPNQSITISDSKGEVQATYNISGSSPGGTANSTSAGTQQASNQPTGGVPTPTTSQ